jgi:ankyrin repeat protein
MPAGTPSKDQLDDFMLAVIGDDVAAIETFLSVFGPAIDEKDTTGRTALMFAAVCGHTHIAELLIQKGADLDVQNTAHFMTGQTGSTALIHAARCGHDDIVKLLLEAGADTEKQNKYGKTALQVARDARMDRAVRVLEEWPEMKKAEEERKRAEARAKWLKETDFSKGLPRPLPAPRPLKPFRKKM